ATGMEVDGRPAHVVAAGYGPGAFAIRRQARELGLGSRVTVTSLVADVEALFATIDVFVSPRTRDWFGAPILAAQAAGRPVVTTGVGAAFALVTEGVNGRFVPAGDPAALASAVSSLLGDPDAAARMGREARRMVAERRSAATAAERTEVVYREVLSDGG
ncbi:MAG: glycosyltransferase, partial [Planctomycetota bacterium]